ncbi:MAG: MFS transporter [Actinobacteria bacterium]|nr:MFS transporter [Actinomycetota bacterium]
MVPQLDLRGRAATDSARSASGGLADGRPPVPSLLPVYLAHATTHLYIGLFPAVLFMLRETFSASYGTLGAVFTAAMLAYGLLSLPTGLVLNRVSPLLVVRLVLVGGAAACVAIAVAPNEIAFAVALVALGVACGPYHTAGLTLVSRVSGNDAKRLGHHGMVGNLGLALAPTFGALLAWSVSWRLPFAVAAVVGLGVAALSLRMPRLVDPGLATGPKGDEAVARATERATEAPSRGTSTNLTALILVYAITIALGFIYRGFATYLPALAAARTGVLPATAVVRGGILASLVYLAGFFGQWWGGHLGGRYHAETLYAVLLGVTALLLAGTFFAVEWWLLAILALTSFVHFTTQPMDNVFTGRYTSLGQRSLGYGTSFALSFGIGSFAALAGGVVADAAGDRLQYVWLMLATVACLATVCAVALAVLARGLRRRTVPGA